MQNLQHEIFLPPPDYARQLYFDNRDEECRLVAMQGIRALITMYAGRGGSIHPDRMSPEKRSALAAYLDMMYWLSIREDNTSDALFYALQLKRTKLYDQKGFGELFSHIKSRIEKHTKKVYRLYMTCNWTGTTQLQENWQHLFENIAHVGQTYLGFSQEGITYILVKEPIDVDYYVVLWGTSFDTPLEKTIFLRTEPAYPEDIRINGQISKHDPGKFLRYFDYEDPRFPNTAENWLARRESNLRDITKYPSLGNYISAVLSDQYVDPGHKLRVDFSRFAVAKSEELKSDNAPKFHIFGYNNSLGFPESVYRGPLPPNDKSSGLFPYKYTLIAENNAIPGYFTEKVVDGILSE